MCACLQKTLGSLRKTTAVDKCGENKVSVDKGCGNACVIEE
jgi:hypothetical protein